MKAGNRRDEGSEKEARNAGLLKDNAVNMLYKMIPIEELKDLPKVYALSMIIVSYIFLISIFIYFLVTSYDAKRVDAYLSLDSSAGECSEVSSPLDGNFLADNRGNWGPSTRPQN